METLTPPFTDYPAFVTAFRTRFEMVDEAGNMLTVLKQLWQGTKMVQDYTVLFKQHAGRTYLSDDDKLIRYRKHLSMFIKDRLAETDRVHNTFDTIVMVATNIDKHHRECLVEKAREAGRATPTPYCRRARRGVTRPLHTSSNHLLTLMPWTSVLELPAMGKQERNGRRHSEGNAIAVEAQNTLPLAASRSAPSVSGAKRLVTHRQSA